MRGSGALAILTPTPTGDADLREAEKLAGDWFAAMVDGDIETFVNMIEIPFYSGYELLVKIEDVWEEYGDAQSISEEMQDVQILSLKGMKISEYKKTYGSGNRILRALSFGDEDVVVIMTLGKEGESHEPSFTLWFRKVNQEIRLAGFGD